MAARAELELHGLVVLREGTSVLEQYWAPYVAEDRPLVYSASKTFTASAIALAIGEGRLALDDRIVDLLPDAVPDPVDPRVAELTVHHVLSMSTGHDTDVLERFGPAAPQDWARIFLSTPPQAPVGSRHVYNNGASWLLGELIRRHTGEDLLDYLRPRLLAPLGIDATWDRDAMGRCLGWSGIHVRTGDLAAMGELYRCDGVWQGRRLLPEGWVARATTAQIPTTEPSREWNLGYGYQLWLGREGYRLDGAWGQFSLVIPERGLVIAITSAQADTQLLLDLVWDVLIPQVESASAAPVGPVPADGAARSLPLPADTGSGSAWSAPGPVAVDETLVSLADPQASPPDLSDVRVQREDGTFRVDLVTAGNALELVAGSGDWVRQSVILGDEELPVAAAAGAGEDGALDLRLVFTDSPHTLRLRVADGRAAMAWATIPLQGGDLARLVAR